MREARLRRHLTSFKKEFFKQLTAFITGAFAFVAALLWRDAIRSFLERYENYIQSFFPIKEAWIIKFYTAFAVSVIAVLAIILVSKFLKVEE